jgi:uncharacterized protein YbgA (DUF1722 family)
MTHDTVSVDEPRLRLGISARQPGGAVCCAAGTRDPFLVDALARFVDWVPVPPENEASLAALDLDGIVVTGRGACAEVLRSWLPMTPVEDEGRLCDLLVRENFIERIYASRRLRRLLTRPRRVRDLVEFHTRHKLQLLAHSPARHAELGRQAARARATTIDGAAADYAREFASALTTMVTRRRHVNVLQHAVGHFRGVLLGAARRGLAAAVVDYERGLIPLVVPIRLIGHYAARYDIRYLRGQVYLDPQPHELTLRTHV